MGQSLSLNRRTFCRSLSAAISSIIAPGCTLCHCGDDGSARLGVCSWSFRLPLDGVADEMRKMGLRRIHLALQPFMEGDSRHGAAEKAGQLEKVEARIASGEWVLSAVMIGFPQEDYTTPATIRRTGGIVPDDAWEANKRIIAAGARLAARLKAPLLTTHAGFLDESSPSAMRKYSDRVKFMVDRCGEVGVGVALETGQETADELARFLQHVPGVGVNFDPANMILYGKGDPVAAVNRPAPWIRHVHVKDALPPARPGDWGMEVPWGDGAVRAGEFLSALDAAGYSGAFAIEREGGSNRVADIALAAKRFRERKCK